jgi:cytochrome c553
MTILKATPLTLAVPTIVLLGAPLALAQGQSDAPAVVTRYCSGCHGLRGEAQLSYVPRLAGMGASYLNSRFEAYRTAARAPVDETFARFRIGREPQPAGLAAPAIAEMIGVAYAVSDKGAKAAIEWYASRQPASTKPHNTAVAEDGRRLYTNGLQEGGVQACQSCHGGSAQGTDTVPRLAGQNAVYVLGQLSLFRTGERRDQPMMDIARNLKDDQARAVARYLQSR